MTSPQLQNTGRFETAQAGKYLQQLCKHFAHKVEVSYDAQSGWVDLPPGRATLEASAEALQVTVTGPDEDGLGLAREIIDNHLVRFAFREGFEAMEWR